MVDVAADQLTLLALRVLEFGEQLLCCADCLFRGIFVERITTKFGVLDHPDHTRSNCISPSCKV